MKHDIEDILKAMPLAAPSRGLDDRVLKTLKDDPVGPVTLAFTVPAASPGSPRLRHARTIAWLGGAAAVAAMIALTLAWALYDPGTSAPDAGAGPSAAAPTADTFVFEPVRIEERWSSVQPGGVVMVDDRTPAAGFVQQSVRHIQLVDDEHNVRMEFTVPRREVVLIPVRYE